MLYLSEGKLTKRQLPEAFVKNPIIPENRFTRLIWDYNSKVFSESFFKYTNYIKELVDNEFTSQVAKQFRLQRVESSPFLTQQIPTLKHYCNRFPESQFKTKDYLLRPSGCATALSIWQKENKTREYPKPWVIHELVDCYRIQNSGNMGFERTCKFEIPDYHLLVGPNSNKFVLFQRIVALLQDFYKKNNLEFIKLLKIANKSELTNFKKQYYVEQFNPEDLGQPYYGVKLEFLMSYQGKWLQTGTVQIDDQYPQIFNLSSSVLHFSPGSISRLLCIFNQEKLPALGLLLVPVAGVELTQLINWAEKLKKDYSGDILIEDRKKRPGLALKQLNMQYPSVLFVGARDIKNQEFEIVDKKTKQNINLNYNQLVTFLNEQSHCKGYLRFCSRGPLI